MCALFFFALKNSSPPLKKLGEKGGITRRGRINSQRKRGMAELGLQIEGGRQCNELLRSGSSCHGSPTYTLIGHRTRVANQKPRQTARQTEICVFLKRCAAVFWFTLFVSQIDSWVSELKRGVGGWGMLTLLDQHGDCCNQGVFSLTFRLGGVFFPLVWFLANGEN